MAEVPNKCKYIQTCTIPIEKDHYEFICSTTNWIHCDFIEAKDLRPYKKSAKEWAKEKEA